jgi:hypothetical protein
MKVKWFCKLLERVELENKKWAEGKMLDAAG